jgi:hypothetical protein
VIADEQARTWAGRFASLDDMAKAGLELRRHASEREGFVKKLSDKATPEEVAAWRQASGVPEAPEGYQIELPKGSAETDQDKEWWGKVQGLAHQHHVSRTGLSALVGEVFAHAAEIEQMRETAMERVKEQGTGELRKLWGGDFDRNWQLAERAHLTYGSKEWDAYAKAVGFYDDPGYRLLMARIGSDVAPYNPLVAVSPAEAEDGMKTLKEEYERRAKEGKLNDADFQRRWAEGWRRVARPGA